MAEKEKKFYIKLDGMTEKEIISEYCKEAKIDEGMAMFSAGEVSAAVRSVLPMDGGPKLRKLNLLYFFAGMRFAKEHEDKYEYGYKDHVPKEEPMEEETMEVVVNDSPSYFG